MNKQNNQYINLDSEIKDAKGVVDAIRSGQTDAIVANNKVMLLRLKEAEQTLRKSEQKYKSLFNSIDEGFCTIEMIFDENQNPVDYRFIEINPAFERHTGIRNAIGKYMRSIAPQHEEHWFQIYGNVAKTGKPIRFQNQASGLGRWFDVYAFRPEHSPSNLVAVLFKDITDKKETELELQHAKQNLEQQVHKRTAQLREANRNLAWQAQLLDLAHDAIIVHDLNGQILFWNKGAENAYGWKNHEVMGKVSHEILKTSFDEPLMKIISAVSTRGIWEGEVVHTTKNGKSITAESRWTLQRNEQGSPTAFLAIERDITDKKVAKKQIQDARRFAESIIETVQEALLVLDENLNIVSTNEIFYEYFDFDRSDTIGKQIHKLGQGRFDKPEFMNMLENILPQKTVIEDYRMQYPMPSGPPRELLINARPIIQDQKHTNRLLLCIRDITKQIQQEKTIMELTEELLLAEEQSRQEIASALHDTVCQMLAVSSNYLQMFIKNPESITAEKLQKVLDMINRSSKQSRKIITDLSSQTLEMVGLEAALEELANNFSKENSIECIVNPPQQRCQLEKKIKYLLYRSVTELMCNIKKHAKCKKVVIDLINDSQTLQIKIEDDGKGFDTSILNTEQTRKSFGLFSIEQRLKNIGGIFSINSQKQKGTTAHLKIPLNQP